MIFYEGQSVESRRMSSPYLTNCSSPYLCLRRRPGRHTPVANVYLREAEHTKPFPSAEFEHESMSKQNRRVIVFTKDDVPENNCKVVD